MRLTFTLNGEAVSVDASPGTMLVDLIRGLDLTGTKEACGVGVCGLCTVLVNDLPVSSCLYLAGSAAGAEIWTVEGMARAEPGLIRAFVEHEGMQCGICTPGQVMVPSTVGVLPATMIGVPSFSKPLLQVSFFTKGLASRNWPLVRSIT